MDSVIVGNVAGEEALAAVGDSTAITMMFVNDYHVGQPGRPGGGPWAGGAPVFPGRMENEADCLTRMEVSV